MRWPRFSSPALSLSTVFLPTKPPPRMPPSCLCLATTLNFQYALHVKLDKDQKVSMIWQLVPYQEQLMEAERKLQWYQV